MLEVKTDYGGSVWRGIVAVLLAGILAVGVIGLTQSQVESDQPVARSSANYGWLRVEEVILSGTGTTGTVSASDDTDGTIRGHLYGVHLDFAGGVTTTTDITITQANPALTVLTLTDYYTDTWYYPAAQQTGATGAAISGAYDRLLIDDRLTIAAGQTISGTIMTATVYYGE